jgi:protein-S-isoprenylcysteine O-methyltransferase Ste14
MRYTHSVDTIRRFLSSSAGSTFTGLLLAPLLLYFSWVHVLHFRESGGFIAIYFVAFEFLQALLLIFRRAPRSVAIDPLDWFIAVPSTVSLYFLIPTNSAFDTVATWLFVFGLLFSLGGIVSLGRSFAYVPANREVQVRGLYRVIRHPMYAGHMVIMLAYLLSFPSLRNIALVAISAMLLVVRLAREERHLSADPEYREYLRHVRWRLIPLVF